MSIPRIQLPGGQHWIFTLMKALGYLSQENGLCVGISLMAVQAILLKDLENFDNRWATIEKLAKYLETMGNPWKDIKKIPDEQLQHANINKTIYAFFDGVELYQQDYRHPELFEKNNAPKTQNPATVFSLLLPQQIIDQGGIYQAKTISGIYREDELRIYFRNLYQALEKNHLSEPIALVLNSAQHTITVGYEPRKKEWLFMNANDLPTQLMPANDFNRIASKVFNAFINDDLDENANVDITAFSTQIYAINNPVLKKAIDHWKESEGWKIIHRLTQEKLNLIDSNHATWLIIAMMDNDLDTVRQLFRKGIDVAPLKIDDWPELLSIAANFNRINIIKELDRHHINLNQVNENGLTPLYIAIKERYVELAEYLCKKDVLHNGITIKTDILKKEARLCRRTTAVAPLLTHLNVIGPFTPLHAAAYFGNVDMVRYLLNKNVNVDARTTNGISAYQFAKAMNHSAISDLLQNQPGPRPDYPMFSSKKRKIEEDPSTRPASKRFKGATHY